MTPADSTVKSSRLHMRSCAVPRLRNRGASVSVERNLRFVEWQAPLAKYVCMLPDAPCCAGSQSLHMLCMRRLRIACMLMHADMTSRPKPAAEPLTSSIAAMHHQQIDQ